MIIDSRVIRKSMGDDPKFIRDAAVGFLSTARTDIENIFRAVNDHEAEGVRFGSHSLKGSAAIFGANDLKHVCTELESAARDINWDFIRTLAPKLTTTLGEVEVALEAFLERISTD